MILVSELQAYREEVQAAIAGVKSSHLVIDESEVVNYLSNKKRSDNQIMLVVMPDARTNARDEDSVMMNNALGFMFLEHTDFSRERQLEWIAVFERTQASAVEFVRKLIRDKSFGSCDFHRYLNVNNIALEPITGLASCNGWTVEVYFETPF